LASAPRSAGYRVFARTRANEMPEIRTAEIPPTPSGVKVNAT
jgi:hypothetical protein